VSRTRKSHVTIDPASLPAHFDSAAAEEKWGARWEAAGTYHYDDSRPRAETFVVDTPPPTVSGSLHIGHVFSYTQTDVLVRQQRMLGRNIFYPMGWDDNGLPTERRVQNYYNVRCDPRAPVSLGLSLEPGGGGEVPPRLVSRRNFIELCLALTGEDEKAFKGLWRRVGLSVDWRQEYSTIDELSRRLAQLSFLDLFARGHVYNVDAPTLWDVDFGTAVAQAEVEERGVPGFFHEIRFGVEGSAESFTIATTRPELLPACVGVTAHPDDERYRHLFGRRAVTPLFHAPVPIFPSELARVDKGTGILMVCTFGDATDVAWWRERKLPLRQIIGRDGALMPVTFGTEGWESLAPEAANRYYAELHGRSVPSARKTIVRLLRDALGSCGDSASLLTGEPVPLRKEDHLVKFFEKGDRPLEFISTRQWFVRLLDKKEELLALGDRINWHPDFMRVRYRNWTENLQHDWCISRQRYFGVPFPVWYRLDEQGRPDFTHPLLAGRDRLPVDPMTDTPPGYSEEQRDRPGGFKGESDVFDTWFTSSLTPQIGSRWLLDPERHAKLFPADLRPQSHEIIRTWAFYTIAKALLHEGSIPWKHIAVSGWILDPDRKKMSKSKGNVVTPARLLNEYSSDAVRYWAASARLGADTTLDEQVLKVGKRLATKLYNAGKFVLAQRGEPRAITCDLDRSFLLKLSRVVGCATEAFERFDFAGALSETERFFWSGFTDAYLELVKARAKDDADAGQGSAVSTLRLALGVLLRLLAPYMPYVTEEIWSWALAEETGQQSIHRAPWPSDADFGGVDLPTGSEAFDLAVKCLAAINQHRAESKVSSGRLIEHLTVVADEATTELLRPVLSDVMRGARVRSYRFETRQEPDATYLEVLAVQFD
jgi:valyl-tRNA synthetase